ncbi:hypothetical protein K2173_010513 [Erythroxylum novogranatense]|uniref:ATP synthase F0 subunit 8 n=1 Tax=Erythroxylum novogranatense TaxID=1862640 RepID=A0AAV8TDT7_9ROSI|nr:hypothetical protein K2173_010513 [Erythroxylum novogranatense]
MFDPFAKFTSSPKTYPPYFLLDIFVPLIMFLNLIVNQACIASKAKRPETFVDKNHYPKESEFFFFSLNLYAFDENIS